MTFLHNLCSHQIREMPKFHGFLFRGIGSFVRRKHMKRVLWFALGLLVGLAACIGTILAMFAWTGASL
jgi:hypothetical protein